MKHKQPEALRMADALDDTEHRDIFLEKETANELRRLHEVNEELLKTMRQLACLGMGDVYGNSYGNVIAQMALNKATGVNK